MAKKVQYTTNDPSASTDYLAGDNTWKPMSGGGGGVPYTGATANVDLGEYGIDVGFLSFDTTPTGTPTTQGTMSWDVDHNTAQLVMNGTTGRILEDVFYIVKNQTGSTIPKGTVVMSAGTLGASGRILIQPFLADGTYPSEYVMGVTAEAIANGADGMVVHFGQIRNVNTSSFADGDILYASSTTAGAFTTTSPTAPNNIVLVAIVVHAASNGTLQVRPTIGSNINKDEGVVISSPTNGQVLSYNSISGLWENTTPTTPSSVQTFGFQLANTIATSATTWVGVGLNNGTNESTSTYIMPVACTLSNMYTMHYNTTQPAYGSQVFTVRKNGVDTALSITISAGSVPTTTPYSNTANSVTFAVGDKLSIRRQNFATAIGGAVNGLSFKMTI